MNTALKNIPIRDYNYALPAEKIAIDPTTRREASRLLEYKNGAILDHYFHELPDLVEDACLVLNDTRVIEARIFFQKPSGGQIEIFCLQPYGNSMETALQQEERSRWVCLIGGASKWKRGQLLQKTFSVGEQTITLEAAYVEKLPEHFLIEFSWTPPAFSFSQIIHAAGHIPLPPYIKRPAKAIDADRYQTVFSKHEGSVAAPTAALHFTPEILQSLAAKNVVPQFITLHVGAGTFKPVKSEIIGEHHMHEEPFIIRKSVLQELLRSEKIIAVGTTCLRTLESLHWIGVKTKYGLPNATTLAQWEAYELQEQFPEMQYRQSLQAIIDAMEAESKESWHCSTSLMVVPGYQFMLPSALITNFHQPQSTLLLLIAAFIGDDWKSVYRHALDNNYRFLSYGDSSLLWRAE